MNSNRKIQSDDGQVYELYEDQFLGKGAFGRVIKGKNISVPKFVI